MCEQLALVAAVERAAKAGAFRPGLGWAVVALLERSPKGLGAADLAELLGEAASVITHAVGMLKRASVVTRDNASGIVLYFLGSRWFSTELSTASNSAKEKQARYRARLKSLGIKKMSDLPQPGHALPHVTTRDFQVVTGGNAGNGAEKVVDFQPVAQAAAPATSLVRVDNDLKDHSLRMVEDGAPDVSDDAQLSKSQLIRKRTVDLVEREAAHLLPAKQYEKLLSGISWAEREQFILRHKQFRFEIQTLFDSVHAKVKARRASTSGAREEQAAMLLPITGDGPRPIGIPGGERAEVDLDGLEFAEAD